MSALQVQNEIGKLQKALLHCPGNETRNYPDGQFNQVFTLRPSNSSFDLEKALAEHRSYSDILKNEGVELFYVEDLLIEALDQSNRARQSFIDLYISECGVGGIELQSAIRDLLEGAKSSLDLVQTAIKGIRYGQVFDTEREAHSLAALTGDAYLPEDLLVNPLNTMWFTRDPVSVIGSGATLNHMYWPERNREVIAYQTIFNYHPTFMGTPQFFKHESTYHLEGGDVHNLNSENVAIGISQRTEPLAIDSLAREVLWNKDSTIESVWAIKVPYDELCIHLDTYFSRVDYDTFLIDRTLLEEAEVYRITRGRREWTTRAAIVEGGIREAIGMALGSNNLRFILCGGSNPAAAERERANNAASTLCLKPGKVCVYGENTETNAALEQAGIELVPISIFELTSGFGGPDCLCLPLARSI